MTLKQIHDAVPKTLLRKDPVISASYVVRDVLICTLLFKFAGQIPFFVNAICGKDKILQQDFESLAKGLLWLWYWWWQGLVFTSFFCIGEFDMPNGQTSSDLSIVAHEVRYYSPMASGEAK